MLAVGILLFALLIIVHELGHFWAARRSGVEVEEFGIGFPPRLLSRKFAKHRTRYSLNLIPLGGFVKLKGENNQDIRPKTFGAASFKNKTKILLAGVGMNVLVAWVMLTLLAWTGLPQITDGQFSVKTDESVDKNQVTVAAIVEESPASKVGIKQGDVILAIGGLSVDSPQALIEFTKQRPNQTVAVTWRSGRDVNNQVLRLDATEEGEGRLGLSPYQERSIRYSWSAPLVALGLTLQLIWLTFVGIAQLLGGLLTAGGSSEAIAGAVGPVGIFALLSNAGNLGLSYVVVLMVVISISLAVINALPIPALDGGRLALIAVFKALKKPLSEKLETTIHGLGFIALLILAVVISYFDVVRFF